MGIQHAIAALQARGDELMAAGPGRINVGVVHDADEVKTCRHALTIEERIEIIDAIDDLEERLTGVAFSRPKRLIDAAELWLIAHVVEDRIDIDCDMLKRPWNEAQVVPATS